MPSPSPPSSTSTERSTRPSATARSRRAGRLHHCSSTGSTKSSFEEGPMKRTKALLWMFISGALAGGCGGSGATGATCEVQKGFCAALTVPQGFNATPVKVIVGLYKTLPATGPSGPPDAVAMQAMNPAISATMPMELKPADLTVSGDYYVYAALYNQGGGMFVPVKG